MSKLRWVSARAVVLLGCCNVGVQGYAATVAEQYLLAAINQERVVRNLAPLRLDPALVAAATEHAQTMVKHHGISHQFAGEPDLSARGFKAGAHFDRVTENVAEGPTVTILHDAWMHSAGHRENILDPKVDAVGIAVVVSSGQLYAVEDFQATVRTLTLEQQEGTVGVLLEKAGLELIPDASARETCALTSGYAGEKQPAYVVRYTTGNLQALPSQLKQRIALKSDHQASVGACVQPGANAFSSYSVAVVLWP